MTQRTDFTWDGARERLDRFAAANRRAWEEYLRALTLEESLRIFEDLGEGIPELDTPRARRDPPVALFRLWRR